MSGTIVLYFSYDEPYLGIMPIQTILTGLGGICEIFCINCIGLGFSQLC